MAIFTNYKYGSIIQPGNLFTLTNIPSQIYIHSYNLTHYPLPNKHILSEQYTINIYIRFCNLIHNSLSQKLIKISFFLSNIPLTYQQDSLTFLILSQTCLGLALWSSNYDPLVWDPPSVIVANVLYNATTYYTRNVTVYDSQMNLQGEIFLTLGECEWTVVSFFFIVKDNF